MGWLISKRRTRSGCRSGRSTWRGIRRAPNVLVLAVVALASAASLAAATQSLVPVARADTPKLTIIVPHPADTHTEGPVGTNITMRAEGLAANGTYALGYASADVGGCSAGFQPFQNIIETASADGKFTATIAWPSNLNSVGVTYYLCAQSTTPVSTPLALVAQSVETFRVDAANAPTIDVAAAGTATGAGTSAPADGSFYRGGAVAITGNNFDPGGSTLVVVVSAQQLRQPADFQSAAQKSLSTSDGGGKITSQSTGDISATVGLPATLATGSYYLYVFSTDGADQAIPSLVASKQIMIVAAPAPQPTATTAPTATSTGGSGGSSTGNTSGPAHQTGVFVLAGLSIILFIAGVIALLSAAAMPRPGRP